MSEDTSTGELISFIGRLKKSLKLLHVEANNYFLAIIVALALSFIISVFIVAFTATTTISLVREGLISLRTINSDDAIRLIYSRVSGAYMVAYAGIAVIQAYLLYRVYRLGRTFSQILPVFKEAREDAVRVLERLGIFREDVEKAEKMIDDTPRILLVTGLINVIAGYFLLILLLNYGATGGVAGVKTVLLLSGIVSAPLAIYMAILYYILFHSIDLVLGLKGSAALSILFPLSYLVAGFDIIYKAYTLQISSSTLELLNTIIMLIIVVYLYSFKKSLERLPDEINKAVEWVRGNISGYRQITHPI